MKLFWRALANENLERLELPTYKRKSAKTTWHGLFKDESGRCRVLATRSTSIEYIGKQRIEEMEIISQLKTSWSTDTPTACRLHDDLDVMEDRLMISANRSTNQL